MGDGFAGLAMRSGNPGSSLKLGTGIAAALNCCELSIFEKLLLFAAISLMNWSMPPCKAIMAASFAEPVVLTP